MPIMNYFQSRTAYGWRSCNVPPFYLLLSNDAFPSSQQINKSDRFLVLAFFLLAQFDLLVEYQSFHADGSGKKTGFRDGKLADLSAVLDRDASVRFVTRKDPEALGLIRHDAAHVLAEAVQTVMRRHGLPNPYEQLKALTRGQAITRESIRAFIAGLDLPDEPKRALLALTPASYTGRAEALAKSV